jgi:hypothetical protein
VGCSRAKALGEVHFFWGWGDELEAESDVFGKR